MTDEADRILKIQLSAAIREKCPREAIKLLEDGAGVDYRDPIIGCWPMHYAAREGYNDVIELLVKKGAKTAVWDNNGKMPLHEAALGGKVQTIVTLVANGATVDTRDRIGNIPLDYAVRNRHVTAVELLCLFGTEPALQDWKWMTESALKNKAPEYAMCKLIKNQLRLMPGYKHEGIKFDVVNIPAGSDPVHMTRIDVVVSGTDRKYSYYLYLCQMEAEFGSPDLEPDEVVFGRVMECRTWGARVDVITITVNITQCLNNNEEVVLKSVGKGGRIDNVERSEEPDVQTTKVTLTVPLAPTGTTLFAMATREKKQVFQISKEAVTLKPDMEPEAEIDIPAGTFESGELSIKFVDTKEVNEDEEERVDAGHKGGTALLLTNVLDLSTTDGQQPSKDIQMKLPVITTEKTDDFVVLSSPDPDPNLEEWDWERIPADVDEFGKAVFTIKHFSIYAGASKVKLDKDQKSVEGAIRQSILKIRKVQFLLMVNEPQPNETRTDAVLLCGTGRKIKTARNELPKYYKCFGQGMATSMVAEGQAFQIQVHGTVKECNDDPDLKIIFQSQDTVSKRAFDIETTSANLAELSGEVEIMTETKFYPEMEVVEKMGCILNRSTNVRMVKSAYFDVKTKSLVRISFNRKLIKIVIPERVDFTAPSPNIPDVAEDQDHGQVISGVTWAALKASMMNLPPDEARQLGAQLGLSDVLVGDVNARTVDESELARNIVNTWHLYRARNDKVSQLQNAIIAIGRQDIIETLRNQGT